MGSNGAGKTHLYNRLYLQLRNHFPPLPADASRVLVLLPLISIAYTRDQKSKFGITATNARSSKESRIQVLAGIADSITLGSFIRTITCVATASPEHRGRREAHPIAEGACHVFCPVAQKFLTRFIYINCRCHVIWQGDALIASA